MIIIILASFPPNNNEADSIMHRKPNLPHPLPVKYGCVIRRCSSASHGSSKAGLAANEKLCGNARPNPQASSEEATELRWNYHWSLIGESQKTDYAVMVSQDCAVATFQNMCIRRHFRCRFASSHPPTIRGFHFRTSKEHIILRHVSG